MGTYDTETALSLMKARTDRMQSDTAKDNLRRACIDAAAQRLEENGIRLNGSPGDTMLLVEMATWIYDNRDKPGAMPEWLRDVRRDRWMSGVMKCDA